MSRNIMTTERPVIKRVEGKRFLTGEDGDTIFEVVPVDDRTQALVPYGSWSKLIESLKEAERQASDPCFLCTDWDQCQDCPNNG